MFLSPWVNIQIYCLFLFILCWAIKRYHAQKMSVAEIRILRWMCDNILNVRNEDIRTKIGGSLYRREDERKSPTMVWSCAT